MKPELDLAERQFLEQLHRLGGGTVHEIGEAIGVTATAVRQRLVRLQGNGLVSRELERAGRGRPHHKYRVTEKGLRQLGDNYGDLAMILWREIQNLPESEVRDQLKARIRDALAARFGQAASAGLLSERLAQLRLAMSERGYDVELDTREGLPILRENNCPYLELAANDRGICELEQEVFEQVLGAPVRLAHCCQDSHHCCEFEVSTTN
jgi:predicted ArsR family transcriptional regulator